MEDKQIVALFWKRDERALRETDRQYRPYLTRVAHNILCDRQDEEECVNDTYLRAWNAIPPHEPVRLSTFLGKITRRLALDRFAARTAEKRGGGTVPLLLEEFRDCLPEQTTDRVTDTIVLRDALNRFLRGLSSEHRRIFVCRYWYADSVRAIARQHNSSESRIKMILLRTRRDLKHFLESEDIGL